MAIINLTPHTINIHCEDCIVTVEPSGTVTRVATSSVPAGRIAGIPTFQVEYGTVEDLPSQGDDVLVVSGMVAAAAPRPDVFSPGELVRDDQGRPIGCLGLKRSCISLSR